MQKFSRPPLTPMSDPATLPDVRYPLVSRLSPTNSTCVSPHPHKHHHRRIPHRRILPRKLQFPTSLIHRKHRDVIRPLIAAIQKPPARIELKTPRIIPPRPLIPHPLQLHIRTHRKNPNAVMQPIPHVHRSE